MIVLYVLGYFNRNKQNSYAALNPPSSVTENVNQDRINVGPLSIEKQTNEFCDVNKLINSIPVTPTAGASSPDTEPESPVFLKHTVQRENKLKYSPTKSERGNQQPGLDVHSGGGPRVVVSTAAFHARVRGSVPGLGGLKETKLFLPHPRVKVSIVGSLCR